MFLFATREPAWLLPPVLAAVGIEGSRLTKTFSTDESVSPSEGTNIFVYTVIALVGLGVGGFLSGKVPTIPAFVEKLSLTPYDIYIYGAVMAISEEPFFRGFLTNLFLSKLPVFVALLLSAAVFGLYHMAVYGTSPQALSFVLISGLILAYVAYKTHRITSGIFAHLANNSMDFLRKVAGGLLG